jgi:hypothetical protein
VTEPTLSERLLAARNGVIFGRFFHDCQDEDIEDGIGGLFCKVCDAFVDNSEY